MSVDTIAMGVLPLEPQGASQNCCPSCGFGLPPAADDMATASALLEAQRKITDLEAQVRILNQKAAAAVDRWADYEDELAQLRRQLQSQSSSEASSEPQTPNQHQHRQPTIDIPSPPPSATLPPPRTLGSDLVQQQQQQQNLQPPPSPQRSSFSRLSALLTRKSVPNLKAQQQQVPPVPKTTSVTPAHSRTNSSTQTTSALPSTFSADAASKEAAELAAALKREQSLRRAAEQRVDETSREVEELSVSLFEQANEMVAAERRARAQLEERVEMLEKRDVEKRRRLDKLEIALKRIERVRGVLEKKEEEVVVLVKNDEGEEMRL